MHHLVMFSGGIASWGAARRCVEKYGSENVTLLFSDTKIEDEDLYRFLHQTADMLKAPLVILADGRTPWEVFKDERYIGNSRVDPCSRILKREITRKWLEDTYGPEDVTVHLGMDWTEMHRMDRARPHWKPYTIDAPLLWEPMVGKPRLIADLAELNIELPRLYKLGFQHNNCGGFCVKAGHANFKLLLETMPERYAEHEREEEAMREYLDKDIAIMRDRSGGKSRPLTLRNFRLRLEDKNPQPVDELDWGGCGCFTDED